jgi:hypothetical protein
VAKRWLGKRVNFTSMACSQNMKQSIILMI